MSRTSSVDTLRKKVSGITSDSKREAAAKEARRKWEHAREALTDRADALSDAAEDQWEHARDAAGPKVKQLRKKADDLLDTDFDFDFHKMKAEVATAANRMGDNLITLGTDLRDASSAEADRVIQAIQDSADEVRLQTEERERKRRIRALIGWTLFGMAAGAVLAMQFGPKNEDVNPVAEIDDDPSDDASAELGSTQGSPA